MEITCQGCGELFDKESLDDYDEAKAKANGKKRKKTCGHCIKAKRYASSHRNFLYVKVERDGSRRTF